MINDLIQYIAKELKAQNDYFHSYDSCCFKNAKGIVIKGWGAEETHCGISDQKSRAFYIRHNGAFSINSVTSKSSCGATKQITVPLRLVAYSFDSSLPLNPYGLEEKLRYNLISMGFQNYTGYESSVKINISSSNIIREEILQAEMPERINEGSYFSSVMIDFELIFQQRATCIENCDLFTQPKDC